MKIIILENLEDYKDDFLDYNEDKYYLVNTFKDFKKYAHKEKHHQNIDIITSDYSKLLNDLQKNNIFISDKFKDIKESDLDKENNYFILDFILIDSIIEQLGYKSRPMRTYKNNKVKYNNKEISDIEFELLIADKENVFHSLTRCKYKDVTMSLTDIEEVTMVTLRNNSIWIDGDCNFYCDVLDSKWLNGMFSNGNFENSKWFNGTFKYGNFENSIWFNGIWENGIFKNESVWHNGIFYKGMFDRSIWRDGTFKGDVFYKSIWHNGIFKEGRFQESTLNDGIFKGGSFQSSKWKDGKWDGGLWYIDINSKFQGINSDAESVKNVIFRFYDDKNEYTIKELVKNKKYLVDNYLKKYNRTYIDLFSYRFYKS